jgi:hypothetical protein
MMFAPHFDMIFASAAASSSVKLVNAVGILLFTKKVIVGDQLS